MQSAARFGKVFEIYMRLGATWTRNICSANMQCKHGVWCSIPPSADPYGETMWPSNALPWRWLSLPST